MEYTSKDLEAEEVALINEALIFTIRQTATNMAATKETEKIQELNDYIKRLLDLKDKLNS